MRFNNYRGLARLVAAAFFLTLTSLNLLAQSKPAVWNNECATCHGAYANPLSVSASYGKILNAPLTSVGAFRTFLQGAVAPMATYGAAPPTGLTDGNLDLIRNYLIEARDGFVSSPSFANTTVGNSTSSNITITNMRGAAITYSVLPAISGTHASNFSVTAQSCASRVVPADGGSCTITVQFAPSTFGLRQATLNLSFTTSGGDPQPPNRSISLSGTGLQASFGVGIANLNFSTMEGTNVTASTTISNSGNASMTLSNLVFSGAASGDYSFAPSNTCSIGGAVAAAGSCTLAVRFAPSLGITGARNATLTVTHTAPGGSQAITLTGTSTVAPAPQIALNQSSLAFGSVQLGSSLGSTAVTVSNTGDAPLNWTAMTLAGSHPGDFSRSGTCSLGTPIAASGSCTIIMTFSPAALGSRSATLTLSSDAQNGAQVITLGGTGIPVPAPLVSLSAATLAFGTQTIGGLYQPKTITLSNTGTAALSISGNSVTGSGYSLASTTCGASLAAGSSCAINIQFNPLTVSASFTGSLTLTTNAAGSPHTVSLDGQGTTAAAPVLTWLTAGPLDFGSVATGVISAEQIATLRNDGPGGATLNLVNIVGAQSSNFVVDLTGCSVGAVFYEAQTCQVRLRFAPASLGSKSASVQVVSTGASPGMLGLQGAGSGSAAANIALSPASLAFGQLRVGEGSTPKELRLRNSGSSVLRITKLTLSGPYSLQYLSCPVPPFDLQPGFDCAVALTFLPASSGAANGSLLIESDAVDSPNAVVTLTGQGEAAPQVSNGGFGSGGGGGGCSIASGDSPFDPTLWLIVLGAGGVLLYRRRQARLPLASDQDRGA